VNLLRFFTSSIVAPRHAFPPRTVGSGVDAAAGGGDRERAASDPLPPNGALPPRRALRWRRSSAAARRNSHAMIASVDGVTLNDEFFDRHNHQRC
jgi:hypothetical protein